MKHKWHKEIVAWANGAEIECNSVLNPEDKGWLLANYGINWDNPNLIFRVKKNWYENIPEQGRLCWVSNDNPTEKEKIAIIVGITENLIYYTKSVSGWRFATPLTNDEISQFLI